MITLGELAEKIQAQVKGDPRCIITGLSTLQAAQSRQLTFLANSKYRKLLPQTKASAVILTESDVSRCPCNALVVKDPYYAYALIASQFLKKKPIKPGIHATAIIGQHCQIDKTACISAQVVIGDYVVVGVNSYIGPGCVIGDHVEMGQDNYFYPRVTLYHDVKLKDRVILQSGAVLGSDGFGFAPHAGQFHKIPQLGRVCVGNDVEIGANTTVDRGALGDTIIEDGVKLDNQIQVGHNVQIGAHTVIAGCTGIAGSVKIGKHCMIGGAARVSGHIEIADGVILTAGTGISTSIHKPGIYSSGIPGEEAHVWRRIVARLRHLDEYVKRLRKLEFLHKQENHHECERK